MPREVVHTSTQVIFNQNGASLLLQDALLLHSAKPTRVADAQNLPKCGGHWSTSTAILCGGLMVWTGQAASRRRLTVALPTRSLCFFEEEVYYSALCPKHLELMQ